jgi:hypothetical protein
VEGRSVAASPRRGVWPLEPTLVGPPSRVGRRAAVQQIQLCATVSAAPTSLRHRVQLAVGAVVGHALVGVPAVPPVVGEVQLPGSRVEVEAHRVAHAGGHQGDVAAVAAYAVDGAVAPHRLAGALPASRAQGAATSCISFGQGAPDAADPRS